MVSVDIRIAKIKGAVEQLNALLGATLAEDGSMAITVYNIVKEFREYLEWIDDVLKSDPDSVQKYGHQLAEIVELSKIESIKREITWSLNALNYTPKD